MSIIFLEKTRVLPAGGAAPAEPRLWASGGPQEDVALGYRRKGAKELTEILKQLTQEKKKWSEVNSSKWFPGRSVQVLTPPPVRQEVKLSIFCVCVCGVRAVQRKGRRYTMFWAGVRVGPAKRGGSRRTNL